MLKTEAYQLLHDILRNASDGQTRDVADVLRLGAGHIGLPPGRRYHYISLIDAIQFAGGGEGDPEFAPIRSGDWETVLVSLVLAGDWDVIHRTAEDLRGDADPR